MCVGGAGSGHDPCFLEWKARIRIKYTYKCVSGVFVLVAGTEVQGIRTPFLCNFLLPVELKEGKGTDFNLSSVSFPEALLIKLPVQVHGYRHRHATRRHPL